MVVDEAKRVLYFFLHALNIHSIYCTILHSLEIEVGKILGKGAFCTVSTLDHVNLIQENQEEKMEEISSEIQEDGSEHVNVTLPKSLEMMRRNSTSMEFWYHYTRSYLHQ